MTSGLITLAIFIDGRKCIRIPDKKRKIQFFLWPVYAMIADAINRMAIFISNYYVYFTHYPPPKLTPSPDAVIVITNYLPSYIMLFIEIILLILIIRRLVSSNQKKLAADS